MKPLSDRMVAVLKLLGEGERVSFHPYMGRFNPRAYYSCWKLKPSSCTKQVEALLDRGLAKRVNMKQYSSDHEIAITDEGRKVLESFAAKRSET